VTWRPHRGGGLAIRKLARSTGQDAQELQIVYALEGLISRLAKSAHRNDLVLAPWNPGAVNNRADLSRLAAPAAGLTPQAPTPRPAYSFVIHLRP
jgi:hypothetical protein